jgi:hypothetical protein
MGSRARDAGGMAAMALWGWWFTPLPLGRVAALRVIIYLFVWFDVFVYSPGTSGEADVMSSYRPLAISRVLHLPAPTPHVELTVKIALLCCATAAAAGRAPRLLGTVTFALYLDWLQMGDSFGYVPHDRFAFVVALAVMPTVGPARRGDLTLSEGAGWALRCIQVAVVATYALAAWAKFRLGGPGWVNSAVLTWAVLRRGTVLGTPLLHLPALLHLSQWLMLGAELSSPIVLFLRGRLIYAAVAAMLLFHLVSEAAISISFLPHVLCIMAFLPVERVSGLAAQWRGPPRGRLIRSKLFIAGGVTAGAVAGTKGWLPFRAESQGVSRMGQAAGTGPVPGDGGRSPSQ